MHAIVFAEDNYEDLELHYPRLRLKEAGYVVSVVGPQKKTYKSKFGYWATADKTFDEVNIDEVKVCIIPGGWAPDRLRRFKECTTLIKNLHDKGCVIGHICHGGSLAISAHILKGVKSTSFPSIKDDIVYAGGVWSDDKCVVDEKARYVLFCGTQ